MLTQKKIHHVDDILGVFPSPKNCVRRMMRTVICACIAWIMGGATWAGPSYVAAILDGESLALLHGFQPRKAVSPASLTKLMTLYLLFDALEKKRVSMDTVWRASLNASNQPMTHWGLCAGQKVKVRQCILGIAVRSCNDMAVVVAENLAGSVGNFAQLMNRTAKTMGMKNTFFVNSSGLYDSKQKSSAYDMGVLLGRLCQRFPAYSSCLGIRSFYHKGTKLKNTNPLLGKVRGMCVGKTGFTSLSGWNMATLTTRNNRTVIVVVMGMNTPNARNAHMARLIEGFYLCPQRLERILKAPLSQCNVGEASYKTKQKSKTKKKSKKRVTHKAFRSKVAKTSPRS